MLCQPTLGAGSHLLLKPHELCVQMYHKTRGIFTVSLEDLPRRALIVVHGRGRRHVWRCSTRAAPSSAWHKSPTTYMVPNRSRHYYT